MLVTLFILLSLIACSRITFYKLSYNLMSMLDSVIIKMVLFFQTYNVLFILCPARYAIYDIETNTIGGGVAAWISMDLVAKRRLDLEVHSVEDMWLEVRNCNHTFLICTVYRPHTESITFWESMQFMLDNARHTGISNILFAGDLNADKLSRSGDVKRNGEMFDFFLSVNHLSSHIN